MGPLNGGRLADVVIMSSTVMRPGPADGLALSACITPIQACLPVRCFGVLATASHVPFHGASLDR